MILLFAALVAIAQAGNQPRWTPPVRSEISVRDDAYPGTIVLEVDARRSAQRVLSAREVIPVSGPGSLTLRYPQWLQANHAPTGAVGSIANLRFTAAGRPLAWKRDPVDMYAFHLWTPLRLQAVSGSSDA